MSRKSALGGPQVVLDNTRGRAAGLALGFEVEIPLGHWAFGLTDGYHGQCSYTCRVIAKWASFSV